MCPLIYAYSSLRSIASNMRSKAFLILLREVNENRPDKTFPRGEKEQAPLKSGLQNFYEKIISWKREKRILAGGGGKHIQVRYLSKKLFVLRCDVALKYYVRSVGEAAAKTP